MTKSVPIVDNLAYGFEGNSSTLYPLTPERKLWGYVLIRAIHELKVGVKLMEGKYRDPEKVLLIENICLQSFFFDDFPASQVKSLAWILDQLFLDPEAALKKLRKHLIPYKRDFSQLTDPNFNHHNYDGISVQVQKCTSGFRMVRPKQSRSLKIPQYH